MSVYEDILATAINHGTSPDHVIAVFAAGCILVGALAFGFGMAIARFFFWLIRRIRFRKGKAPLTGR